jgi:hypothetical protein
MKKAAHRKGRPKSYFESIGLSNGQGRGWFRANFAIRALTGLGLFVNGTYLRQSHRLQWPRVLDERHSWVVPAWSQFEQIGISYFQYARAEN